MKYNDNGEYKDIYVKSFDTLPVGTEVDYIGSTVPSGWTQVSGKTYVEYTLYDNSTGSSDTITLSDSAANYDKLIFYYKDANNFFSSAEIVNPNNKAICLAITFVNNTTSRFLGSYAIKTINGTSITTNYAGGISAYNNQNVTITNSIVLITKVVGCKEV